MCDRRQVLFLGWNFPAVVLYCTPPSAFCSQSHYSGQINTTLTAVPDYIMGVIICGLPWISFVDVVWAKLWHMPDKCNGTSKLAISVHSTIATSEVDITNTLMSSCSSV